MKVRPEALIGALLILSAFGVPSTTAKTGDEICVGEETWFDDAEGDGGYLLLDEASTSELMDIDALLVEETGDDCASISFTFSVVGEGGALSPDSVTYKVDPTEADDDDPDITMTFTFGTDEGAALFMDDNEITADVTVTGTGTRLTLTAAKSIFGGITQWDGVSASTTTVDGNEVQGIYETDSASSDTTLLVDYGLDSDGDGLPDAWEIEHFGDLETSDGTGDTDGDGVSDAQEYQDGTDPTDPDDCICPEEEEDEGPTTPKITHEDDDGEPGMSGNETLGEGDAYAYTFNEAGNYTFKDGQNEDNTMTVNVKDEEDPNGPKDHIVNVTDSGFDPEELTIHKGDRVIFVNNDAQPHSVVQAEEGGTGIDFSKFETESDYAIIAGAGAGGVVVLSLIALLARWKL